MKKIRFRRGAALLFAGGWLAGVGSCLPDNYFALSTRNITVAVADTILGTLITPLFDVLPGPSATTVTGTSSGTGTSAGTGTDTGTTVGGTPAP